MMTASGPLPPTAHPRDRFAEPTRGPSRRTFLGQCLGSCLSACAAGHLVNPGQLFAANTGLHKAAFWESLANGATKCRLCPNECVRHPGKNGKCHSRGNRGGAFYSLTYGRPSVIALDPVEKSPLYHFPVSGPVFSIATAGCNLICHYCQNWQFTQVGPNDVKTYDLPPAEVIKRAEKHGVKAISFFYSEPTIYFEYMKDIALLARGKGMKTICVTAGYVMPEPLEQLIPLIDAFVVGLKGFDDAFYSKYIGCKLEPVKNTLRILANSRKKPWFEIVNLLVTGLNDRPESIEAMLQWMVRDLGKDIPLHFTRFQPQYKLKNLPTTPIQTMKNAYDAAQARGLNYVYVGNVPGHKGSNTFCPKCGRAVIERVGLKTVRHVLQNGKCPCGFVVPGRWAI